MENLIEIFGMTKNIERYISTVLAKYVLLKSFSPPLGANKVSCSEDGNFLFTNRLCRNFLAGSSFLFSCSEEADTYRKKVFFNRLEKYKPDAAFFFLLKEGKKTP